MNIGDKSFDFSLIKKSNSLIIMILLCVSLYSQQSESVINFSDREIQLDPFLEDFPYAEFSMSEDGTKLLFFDQGEGGRLRIVDIAKDFTLEAAEEVIDLDFSKRNGWSPEYNINDNGVYWVGDEDNGEIMNIYRTILGSHKLERLTNGSYIYAWKFNSKGTKMAYVVRLGSDEDSQSELRVLDMRANIDDLIIRDNSDIRFTWGDISWQPNDEGLIVSVIKNKNRSQANIAYVDLKAPSFKVLTDDSKPASLSGTKVLDSWTSVDTGFYLSDEDGVSNLYKYSLTDGKVRKITNYKADIDDLRLVTVKGEKLIVALQKNPIKTKIILMDYNTGKELWIQESNLNLSFGAVSGARVKFLARGTDTFFKVLIGNLSRSGIRFDKDTAYSKFLNKELVHSEVERIEIPTFDIDTAINEVRKIHAYLYKPLKPLKKGKEIVMIESFYGGSNNYSRDYQIYNQAGIYVLSPSPRGSAGFGKEYLAMNDGDLGGNEILDIIYAAKYISEKLGIPPRQVGVFGMSHGGYATMRLMTFPGEVNGNRAYFPFGFGIATAGFSDIIFSHQNSNISGWTLLEAGDPEKDSLKLVDRSPINHAEKTSGPLLLFHGNNDNRVNVEGSRRMAHKLDSLGKPYKYIEFEGLGHGIKGVDNLKEYFEVVFGFIEDEVLSKIDLN